MKLSGKRGCCAETDEKIPQRRRGSSLHRCRQQERTDQSAEKRTALVGAVTEFCHRTQIAHDMTNAESETERGLTANEHGWVPKWSPGRAKSFTGHAPPVVMPAGRERGKFSDNVRAIQTESSLRVYTSAGWVELDTRQAFVTPRPQDRPEWYGLGTPRVVMSGYRNITAPESVPFVSDAMRA